MSKTTKTYIEKNWTAFAIQGIIGLAFGIFFLFANTLAVAPLVTLAALAIAGFAIIEIYNIFGRKGSTEGRGATVAIAIIDIIAAAALVFLRDATYVNHVIIIAGFSFLSGIFEIYIGLKLLSDKFDRGIWIVCGMLGAIFSFIILADQGWSQTAFMQFFGTYLMIRGLTSLTYSIHAKNTTPKHK